MQSVWRVASSNRFKTTERPHLRTSLSHAHYKLSAEYCHRRILCIQNRPAGCILPCTNTSRQQEVPTFCLRKQGISFGVLSFSLNTAPRIFTHLGHTVAAYLHRQGISLIPYLDDWLIHHPDCQALLRHQSQLQNALDLIGLKLNEAKSELDPFQNIQFLGLRLRLDQGRASLPISKSR